jgi:ATP-dependent DNA ligase
MHATQLPKPFHRHGWVYEEKYDGWRMVAEKVGSQGEAHQPERP